MPIHEPGRRLMHAVPLEFVQKKVGGHGNRAINAGLSLTSMIDFLIVVVVFLLMTFSASGEIGPAKDIVIPKAQNTLDMIDAPMVAVSKGVIMVGSKPAGNTRAIEESKRMQRIDELYNELKAVRENWRSVNPGKEFPGVVVLQFDQEASAVIVKSVFQTAAFAGYPNVSFMVGSIPKSSSGE